jgi:hypothetical protein
VATESDGKPDERIYESFMLDRRDLIDNPRAKIICLRDADMHHSILSPLSSTRAITGCFNLTVVEIKASPV